MGGSLRPLDCCDSECALVNGCQVGGYQCARCGEWFCGDEIGEDGICLDCEANVAREREQEESEEENQ